MSIMLPVAVIPSDTVYSTETTPKTAENTAQAPKNEDLPIYTSETEEIRGYIREKAELMGVNPDLAEDLAYWESNFDPMAKNSQTSASGIYQFTSETFQHFCVSDTYNPSVFNWRSNVDCALRIIYWEGLDRWSCDPTINKLLKSNGYL